MSGPRSGGVVLRDVDGTRHLRNGEQWWRAGRPDRIWRVSGSPVADVRGAETVGNPALLVRGPQPDDGAVGLTLDDVADRILAGG